MNFKKNTLIFLEISYLLLLFAICYFAFSADRHLFQSGAERWFKIIEDPYSFAALKDNFWNIDRFVQQFILALLIKIFPNLLFDQLEIAYAFSSLFVPFYGCFAVFFISKFFKIKFYYFWYIIGLITLSFAVHAYPTSSLSYSIAFVGALLPIVLFRKSESDFLLILIFLTYLLSAAWNDRSFWLSFALTVAAFKNYKNYSQRYSSLFQFILFFLGGLFGLSRYIFRLKYEGFLQKELFQMPSYFILWICLLIICFVTLSLLYLRGYLQIKRNAKLLFWIPSLGTLFYLVYFLIINRSNVWYAVYENRHYVGFLVFLFLFFWINFHSDLEKIFINNKYFKFSTLTLTILTLFTALTYDFGVTRMWLSERNQVLNEISSQRGCIRYSEQKIKSIDSPNFIWSWPAFSILIQKTYSPSMIIIPEELGEDAYLQCSRLDFNDLKLSSVLDFISNLPER